MKTSLAITGVGMLSPVGLGSGVCIHTIRSGISRLALLRIPDRTQNWLSGGGVLTWTKDDREQRLRRMAELALDEALEQAGVGRDFRKPGPAGLFLIAPEPQRPGYRFPDPQFDPVGWYAGLGYPPPKDAQVLSNGASGAQAALERAAGMLGTSLPSFCIIGVSDTLLQLRVVRWLEDLRRLKCSYIPDGLMPGEGAVFLVVEAEATAVSRGAKILARVLSTASDNEPANILGEEPNTAGGLTRAARAAIKDAGIDVADLDSVWGDLNGESYRGREWGFTEVRLQVQTHTELRHPADCHGDLGAASGANLLALAAMAQATGWAGGKPQLVFTGSEGGARAATVLGPPPGDAMPMAPVTVGLPRNHAPGGSFSPLAPDDEDYEKSQNPQSSYFHWTLRQEHGDEIASLYNQRNGILRDPELPWTKAADPEQRLLNHVDAVIAEGPKAIWAVASGVLSDDEALCFAGAFVLASLDDPDALNHLDAAFDAGGDTNLAGVEAGLKHAPTNARIQSHLVAWLDHDRTEVRALAARVAADRGGVDPRRIAPLFDSTEPLVLRSAALAALRFPSSTFPKDLDRLTLTSYPLVPGTALTVARRLNTADAEARCRALAGDVAFDSHAAVLLALGGKASDVRGLSYATTIFPDRNFILALGLLGRVEGVPRLLALLKDEDPALSLAAAEALYRITGMDAKTTVTKTEKVDLIDEVVEEQTQVVQRVTDPDVWADWWRANSARFTPTERWRLGKPYSAAVVLDELRDPMTPLEERQRATVELSVALGRTIQFEPDWFVARQREALAALEATVGR